MTNVRDSYAAKEHVYELCSLRFECHVYGQLLALLLSTSLMFQMRELLLRKKKCEISELKAIGILKEYLAALQEALRKQIPDIRQVLLQILQMMEKNL
jgi:hypothetical protein